MSAPTQPAFDFAAPALPYAGTSGWSGSQTSHDRATTADTNGRTSARQTQTLALLDGAAENGLTWAEVSELTGWHHGTSSGALSVLHKVGRITRLKDERRGSCAIYVLPVYANGRPTVAQGRAASTAKGCGHVCPDCAGESNA